MKESLSLSDQNFVQLSLWCFFVSLVVNSVLKNSLLWHEKERDGDGSSLVEDDDDGDDLDAHIDDLSERAAEH